MAVASMETAPSRRSVADSGYEWKAVTLLALGFGLVGFDRWIIAPLFPAIMQDLGLSYHHLGILVGMLGVAWGVFSTLFGSVSDRIGRRKVLIPAILLFSLLSGLSGLAAGMTSLLLIRLIMGCTEGAFCPASVAATAEAAHPSRRGFAQGLQLSLFALLGLGLAPIVATQLLAVVPSWRWVFFLTAIPGLIVAVLMFLVIREPAELALPAPTRRPPWGDILRSRNVVLCMLGLLCAMAGVFVLGAMVPSYLVDHLKLSTTEMGFIVAAVGFGGFFGEFGVPGLSDLFGRKPMAALSFAGATLAIFAFSRIGATPWLLFAALLVVSFFCFGLLALLTGPIPTESVSPALIASAIGIVSGAGEIFGGGIAPAIAGYIADHFGIEYTLYLAMGGVAVGFVVSLFIRETAPAQAAKAAVGR